MPERIPIPPDVFVGISQSFTISYSKSGHGFFRRRLGISYFPVINRPSACGRTQLEAPYEGDGAATLSHWVEYVAGPPLQAHVFMAGVAVAIALGALGATLGNVFAIQLNVPPTSSAPDPEITEARAGSIKESQSNSSSQILRPFFPSGRYWRIAALAAVFTAFLGIWALSRPDEAGTWSPAKLSAAVSDKKDNPDGPVTRRVAHVAVGTGIIVLLLILMIISGHMPKRRRVFVVVSLLLILFVAAQIWLGILLLYDGIGVKMGQPFYRFRPLEPQTSFHLSPGRPPGGLQTYVEA